MLKTDRPFPLDGADAPQPSLLHHFFERSAATWPDACAVDVPPRNGNDRVRLTYAALGHRADVLAAALSPLIGPESIVAILLPRRSSHLYAAQLAVLKGGAAYTCIDVGFPDDHASGILADASPAALLTDADGATRALRLGFRRELTIDVTAVAESGNLPPRPPSPTWVTPSSLAYLIYTSGTTGKPKGVMIEHRSIANLVSGNIVELGMRPGDRIGQSSSVAYDVSVEEIWLAFASGATLVVMDEETVRLGPDLVGWMRRERITVLCPPPTLLRATGCTDPEHELPELRLLYVGGEVLPRDVADAWGRGRRLMNAYGPSEATVTALRGDVLPGDPITIGRPLPGYDAWVLNEASEEVPDGEPGELCLGGIGVGRGYRNLPELTTKKFALHPRLGRIFHTGDLVHKGPDGNYFFHGRIDTQVKLRGYRIELEAIETQLAECEGVREAACRVQDDGAQQTLAAYVVPEQGAVLSAEELRLALRSRLPVYMVPARFAFLGELPLTAGGKIDRKRLPFLEAPPAAERAIVPPADELELRLESAFRAVLRQAGEISVEDDFFNDLGGDSLNAAELVSLLRNDPLTSSAAVRDLYEGRSVAGIARRLHEKEELRGQESAGAPEVPLPSAGRILFAAAVQGGWLLLGLILGSVLTWFAAFEALPRLIDALGMPLFILISPALFFAAVSVYTPLSVLLAVLLKKLLIGRYQPLREPVWGSFYLRNWMMQQAVRIIPWGMLEGTIFQLSALRLLGARIGNRVHIQRGVDLRKGGWDLLEIGDDVSIGQEAVLRLVDLEEGRIVVGRVRLGKGTTVETRALVGTNCAIEENGYLTAHSALEDGGNIPSGERWDGVPARRKGGAPHPPALNDARGILSPAMFSLALVSARSALALLLMLPLELLTIGAALATGVTTQAALEWLSAPTFDPSFVLITILLASVSVPITLALEGALMRALGRTAPGVIDRWSLGYVRVWLKTQLLNSASELLSGTLFWPHWLRLAGMQIGKGCEISRIVDVVPELISIGDECFFADGIYLGNPRVHRGTVTLCRTTLSHDTFLGNHVVIPCGQQLPENILIGISTVADDSVMCAGTSWFGHPPFELPRREVVEFDRSLTHDPGFIRYWTRVIWETLRCGIPAVPSLLLLGWYELMVRGEDTLPLPLFLLVAVPALNLALAGSLCLLVLLLKWALLARVRPGMHPLWSCWVARWDFLFVAWRIYARRALTALEGTVYLNWYLRAMGMKVGRGAVLGGRYGQVVDPDMLTFEAGSTVDCQFQAHTFEDRVLKIGYVRIGRFATVGQGAVLLYGADIGEGTTVSPNSVVMKHEKLLPGRSYAGSPGRLIERKKPTVTNPPM